MVPSCLLRHQTCFFFFLLLFLQPCLLFLQAEPEAPVFFSDKLVNDAPKMTSSASQPDLLGGWDSWAAGKTASVSATANKSSYTNTGELRSSPNGLLNVLYEWKKPET